MDRSVQRILDANFNRAREALRVLEEHARMILDDAIAAQRVKTLRHRMSALTGEFGADAGLAARDIVGDVGTSLSTETERVRANPEAVARAAAKRAGEALRVIEEYGKIVDPKLAGQFQALRYELYDIEASVFLGSPRRKRLREARLHVLLTELLCRGDWFAVADQALRGGADVLQMREKSLADRELLDRARRLRELTQEHAALLIINDRPDIAVLADADGVHLGLTDLPVSDARRILGHQRLIGATAHAVEEANRELNDDADYLGVGPMFASPTKPHVPVNGPTLLRSIHLEVSRGSRRVPLVAIGGITEQNIGSLVSELRDLPIGRGASADDESPQLPPYAIAVCQAVIAADDPEAAARRLRSAVERTTIAR